MYHWIPANQIDFEIQVRNNVKTGFDWIVILPIIDYTSSVYLAS